ncbi:hypothetical protein G9A89_016821 [Geosiphon pyriformis]|nr:hypothetical protein G9A89_016821 [Geosiphon pyriformis]
MAPPLPIDLLPNILKNFESDANSLFSCLLVSRLWCRIVIPMLWRNPFDLISTLRKLDPKKREEKHAKIIDVYITCFSSSEKSDLLERTSIYLPNRKSPQLFNYTQHLRSLDDKKILGAIWEWKLKRATKNDGHDAYVLLFALIRMFAQNSKDLEHLLLNSCFYDKSLDRRKRYFKGTEGRSVPLVDIYTAIANAQHKLRTIWFSKANALSLAEAIIETTQIVTIIKAQQHNAYLREFKISSCRSGLGEILEALSIGESAKSLRRITFSCCDFTELDTARIQRAVEFFSGMESVMLRMCRGYEGEFLTILKSKMILVSNVGGFVSNLEARAHPVNLLQK